MEYPPSQLQYSDLPENNEDESNVGNVDSIPSESEFIELFESRGLNEYADAYKTVVRFAHRIQESGGKALLVGGFVRDILIGNVPKDFDVEVYGIQPEELELIAQQFGTVNEVGKAFGILKVSTEYGVDLDISLPRKDSKVGDGHRGFTVEADPTMNIKDAAKRRDFTFNAMAADPLTQEIHDPFGGVEDLSNGLLRVTDTQLFQDDPLRVLRAIQFVGRMELAIEPESFKLMAEMTPSLRELPKERIVEEWRKLLLKSPKPSLGLAAGMELGVFRELHEVLPPLTETEQEHEWHPEGNVWVHTLMVVDEAAKIVREERLDEDEAWVVLLSALCHDLGKPSTTEFTEGRIRSRGHEAAGEIPTLAFLSSLGIPEKSLLASKIVSIVREHLAPTVLYKSDVVKEQPVSDGAIRNLARRLHPATIRELVLVASADHRGRGPFKDPQVPEQYLLPDGFPGGDWLLERARRIDVENDKPADVLQGRDLLNFGLKPSKNIGDLIRLANSVRDALGWDKERIIQELASCEPDNFGERLTAVMNTSNE